MSPRVKRIDNGSIASIGAQLLRESGPASLTYGEVARRSGLAAPTVVQRFATRGHLLAAAVAAINAELINALVMARRTGPPFLPSLLRALQEYAPHQAALIRVSEQTNVSDSVRELRKHISLALAAAIESGELPRCDVAQLARIVQITFTGAVATALVNAVPPGAEVEAALQAQFSEYV